MKKIFALLLTLLFATTAFAADVGGWELNGSSVIDNFGGTTNYTNFTIDSDGGGAGLDSIAFLTQVEFSDVITTACFRYGLRTGTPVAHRISIQGVNTAAFGPDGTILGGGTPASAAFTPPASTAWDGTGQCVTLDNSLTVSRGDFLAFVIEPTGTPDASNKGTFTQSIENLSSRRYMPVTVTKTNGGSWTNDEHLPVFWYKSASRVYGLPLESVSESVVSVDTTPDEYGTAFKLPAGSCDTFKVRGMDCQFANIGSSNKNIRFALYSGVTGASSLNSVTIDSDVWGADGGSYRNLRILFPGTSSALTCGSEYVVSFAPQSSSSGMSRLSFTVDAVNDLGAYALGTAMYMVTRTDDAADFTTATDSRLLCVPIIEDITEPSGSGGPTGKVQGLNEGFN